MTNTAQTLKHINDHLEHMGYGYDSFVERADLTVMDMVAVTGYSETIIRQWIDYCEGLTNEHGEDLQ